MFSVLFDSETVASQNGTIIIHVRVGTLSIFSHSLESTCANCNHTL